MYKLFMALRYLRAHRIIYFCIGGVAVGILGMVVVSSIMGGFARDMQKAIRGMQADLTLGTAYPDVFLPEYGTLVAEIRKIPGVRGAAPRLSNAAWMGGRGTRRVIQLVGIDPEAESGASRIGRYFADGTKNTLDFKLPDGTEPKHPGIVIGSQLTHYVSWSGVVGLMSVRDASTPLFLTRDFEVVGTFVSKMAEYDHGVAFVSLKAMQEFMRVEGARTIAIDLDDYDGDVDRVQMAVLEVTHGLRPCQEAANHLYGRCGKYTVRSWEQEKSILLQAVKVERLMMYIVCGLIVLVAGFCILAIYTMMVRSKQRDIGILRALGGSEGGIVTIFLVSGTVCGLIGCALGVVSGLLLAFNINEIVGFIEMQSAAFNRCSWVGLGRPSEAAGTALLLLKIVPCVAMLVGLWGAWKLFRIRYNFTAGTLLCFAVGEACLWLPALGGGLNDRPVEWLSLELLSLASICLFAVWFRFYGPVDRRQWLWAVPGALLLAGTCWFFFSWMGQGDLAAARNWIVGAALAFPFAVLGLQALAHRFEEGFVRFFFYSFSSVILFLVVGIGVGGSNTMISAILSANPPWHWPGFHLFPSDIYYLTEIPVYVDTLGVIVFVSLTLGASLIFSIYPAIQAARMDPIEAIRDG